MQHNKMEHIKHLRDIYWLLEDKNVLNIDDLMQYYVNNHVHGSVVYLQPKGINIFLHQGQEVLEAVVCVLQALKVYHYAH